MEKQMWKNSKVHANVERENVNIKLIQMIWNIFLSIVLFVLVDQGGVAIQPPTCEGK